ncbi:MAG: hypothetical protein M3Z92_00615 [Bacteroidota bacterium]|nr:hypothetical protein [Bacteroidota bacterium]
MIEPIHNDPEPEQQEGNNGENQNKLVEKNAGEYPGADDETQIEKPGIKKDRVTQQEAYIHNIEETENLIDPGNEHHHHADDAYNKKG